MAWLGWEAGMTGPVVKAAKQVLRRKFSYAKDLDDSEFFGWDLQGVLIEYQVRKNRAGYQPPLNEAGILDWATQKALGLVAPSKPNRVGTLFTVQGTGVDMWTGYPADTARAVEADWLWQPIGNYPAAAFPMGPSVEQGRAELKVQIRNHPGRIALAGYSQGAIVTSMVWKHDILDPRGELHDRLPDVVAAVTWGNPCRELGVARGNERVGLPVPKGRGISDDRLVSTPDWWLDFAHGANSGFGRDIYTDTPDGDAGEDMTAIYKVVQNVSGFVGRNSLLEQVGEIVRSPFTEVPAVFQAVYYGGQFIAYNPPTLPHISYGIDGAVSFLRDTAVGLRAVAAAA